MSHLVIHKIEIGKVKTSTNVMKLLELLLTVIVKHPVQIKNLHILHKFVVSSLAYRHVSQNVSIVPDCVGRQKEMKILKYTNTMIHTIYTQRQIQNDLVTELSKLFQKKTFTKNPHPQTATESRQGSVEARERGGIACFVRYTFNFDNKSLVLANYLVFAAHPILIKQLAVLSYQNAQNDIHCQDTQGVCPLNINK